MLLRPRSRVSRVPGPGRRSVQVAAGRAGGLRSEERTVAAWPPLTRRGRWPRGRRDPPLVAGQRRPGGTMPLEYRTGLVRDMIDKRIGPVAMLLHIGHDHAGQWRNILRLAGHAEVLADEIDVECGPLRIPHEGLHGKADTTGIHERPRRADLEAEPVAKVQGGRLAEVRHGNLPSHLAVEVNVESPPDPDVTGERRGRTFDDPALSRRGRGAPAASN